MKISALKSLPDQSVAQLTKSYCKSWNDGTFPQVWTDAFLGPLPKPGKDHRTLKGHRIIVMQNVVGKIPEKIVAQRIAQFIEPWLSNNLGAYRPVRET